MNVSDLVRADIAAMEPYTPIFPLDVLADRLGLAPDDIIKLDANENPYGTSPAVQNRLANLRYAHIYPDPESRALRAALSDYVGVAADLLLAGAGADELIDLTMRLFLQPGDRIINCPPTFGMYPFDAAINGAKSIAISRRADFSLDLEGIEQATHQHKPKLIFIASPNNPDGGWLPAADLDRLLALPLVVVLDEAYVEFAGAENNRIQQVARRNNLIVLRTFSKWAGLAGLRVGYGAFPAPLMADLWKIKQPYNVSVAASTAAIAALQERAWLDHHVSLILEERERMLSLLTDIPFLDPYPSRSNFVLCRVVGRNARQLKLALEQAGILIRYFNKPGLDGHIRITVGRPDQTETLIAALKRL
jgi:histidinol-phosphate aminotransferase